MNKKIIILNPAAQSDKAARLADRLAALSGGVEIRLSTMPGDAEQIARTAIQEGYTTIIAAGGDGTINEVVNGIAGDVGEKRVAAGQMSGVTLGILPVGTMNVFAISPVQGLAVLCNWRGSGWMRRLCVVPRRSPKKLSGR